MQLSTFSLCFRNDKTLADKVCPDIVDRPAIDEILVQHEICAVCGSAVVCNGDVVCKPDPGPVSSTD
ncbi:hypothetical protein M8J77_006522 [Diaphorina citri]|nr:hypothetical protein M8J77_006522 [Diaphorina citri]